MREPHRVSGETGYSPNKQAGVLASGRSAIFAETVQGLSDVLQAAGLELLLASTSYSLEREEEQLRAMLAWAPAALVVTGLRHTPGALNLMRQAQANRTPVIEIWEKDPAAMELSQIGLNHRSAVQAMAEGALLHAREAGIRVPDGLKILKDLDFKPAGDGIPSSLKPTLIVRNTTRLPGPTPG